MELGEENACRVGFVRPPKGSLRGEAALQRERACCNALQLAMGSGTGGLTNHKLGLDGDLRNVFIARFDEIDNGLRRDLPHLDQWLPHRCESRIGVRRAGNIIEADHGNVFRNAEARFVDRPNRADRGNVVVSEKCRKGMLPRQELLGEGITNGRGRIDAFELRGQFGTNANFELLGYFADCVPTHGVILTDGLLSYEVAFLMTEITKMFQG